MGDPRKSRKKYEKPLRPWDQERISKEVAILRNYGLRRKNEIYKAESILRKFRRHARNLAAQDDKKQEKDLIAKLNKLGFIEKDASLDDVLEMNLENILERRLQTIIFRKGLTKTIKQARQFIVHGHVTVGEDKVKWPSFLVPKELEKNIKVDVDIKE